VLDRELGVMFPPVLRHHPSTFHSSTDSIASEDYLLYCSQMLLQNCNGELGVGSSEFGEFGVRSSSVGRMIEYGYRKH
jgi:hypothetical protein